MQMEYVFVLNRDLVKGSFYFFYITQGINLLFFYCFFFIIIFWGKWWMHLKSKN
jgi:hypothetical protein